MSEDTVDRPPAPPPSQPPSGDDWPARIDELLTEAEAAPSVAERAEVLCRVAEIYERRLGDPNGALVTLQAALEQDPTSGRVVQEMERVARNANVWNQLVAITAEVAAGLEDPNQSADLWVQIAFWDENGLGLPDEAANAARAALDLNPNHGGALALLENLYKRQRSWDRYIEILARKRTRPDYDPYKLIDAYREVLKYEPNHVGALDALARVHEETQAWDLSARDAAQADRSAGAHVDAGRGGGQAGGQAPAGAILKDRLADVRGAEEQLVEVLASPGGDRHVPTMLTLVAIYRERRDWLKARQLLGRAAAVVDDAGERVRLLTEAADICAHELDDEGQAGDIYAEALASAATHRPDRAAGVDPAQAQRLGGAVAARRISGRRGRRDAGDADAARSSEEKARLWYQLARAAEETGDLTRANEAYRVSLAAQPDGDEALAPRRDLAALMFRQERWSEAAAAYEALLATHGPVLKRNDKLTALERLGIAYREAGEPAKAIEPLEKALQLEPRRRVVLETLVDAAKTAGDDDAVVRHTQALLSVTEDREKKRELLEHVATIHHERRKDPQRAIAAYMAALDMWPEERSIMIRLLELLTETKQWKQSVQLLGRLAELTEARAARRIGSPPATSCPRS